MPVLETDFLKSIVDPADRLHRHSVKALARLRSREWRLASSALIELDLVLKGERVGPSERAAVFESLTTEFGHEVILPISHETICNALQFQALYPKMKYFYFDSLHLATAKLHDGTIISSDYSFGEVKEVRWSRLQDL